MNVKKALWIAAAACAVLTANLYCMAADEPAKPAAPLAISEIRVMGNQQMSTKAVLALIKLRVGQRYDDALVKADVQRLLQSRRFDSVTTTRQQTPDGVVVTFVVLERPLIKKLEILGAKKFKTAELMKELAFSSNDPVDMERIERGRDKLQQKYRDGGYYTAVVSYNENQARNGQVIYRIVEGPQAKIRKVVFEGNTFFWKIKLDFSIESKKRFWPFINGYLDPEQVDRDVDTLRNLYVDEGFLDAEVGREILFSPDKKDVTLIFHIRQGPRFRVNEIHFQGNTVYTSDELGKRLQLHRGDFYTALKLQRDTKAVQDAFGELGFIEARVRADRKFLAPNATAPAWASRLDNGRPALVNVTFAIVENDPFTVGKIDIRGNTITQDRVIRRELRFYPQQLYNSVAVEESRKRLEESGMFEQKGVTITPQGKEPGVRDALVQVKEGRTAQFIVGVGVSSNNGLLGNISFSQKNFDINNPGGWNALKEGTAWKGAGQTFTITAEPGTELNRASINWFTPYIGDLPYSFNSKIFFFDRERERYYETRAGIVNSVGHRFKNDWYGELANRIEGVDIRDVDSDAAPEVIEEKGVSWLVGLKASLTRDRTDSRFLPSKGDRLRISYEQVTGSYNFGVAEADYRIYHTLWLDALDRKHILATRVAAGQIIGDAPVFEKFYGGGLGSMRGFKYRGISPRSGPHNDPIGGDFSFFLGTEYSFPLIGDQLRGVIFLDTGTVDDNANFSHYRAAVGPGIRWVIPFFGQVPLSLDFGFPLLKSDHDDTQIFSFSFGVTF